MSIEKKSYYLGNDKPSEREKTDFKSSKRPIVGPGRFVLYKNYDLYDTPEWQEKGVGPGPGLHGAKPGEYKSVQEFLEKRRKRNKDKYKAKPQEYYAADDNHIGDKEKRKKELKKILRKSQLENAITKSAQVITDAQSYDTAIHSYPVDEIFQDSSMSPAGTQIGGMYDYLSPGLHVDNVSTDFPIGWIRNDEDENYAKSKKHKAKKHKARLSKVHGLLDRMVGRSYSGYPYGYGGYGGFGRGNYNSNNTTTNNTTNNYDDAPSGGSEDTGGGDAGGDGGGGDGGGGE